MWPDARGVRPRCVFVVDLEDDSTRSSRETAGAFSWRGRATARRMHHRPGAALIILGSVTIMVLAACSSSSSDSTMPTSSASMGVGTSSTQTASTQVVSTPASSPPDSTTTTPPTDPTAQPALNAFAHYITASYNAQRAPRQVGGSYPPASDFTRYAFDPMLTQENAYIASLAASNQAFRGTPPAPRLRVVETELDAKPYPTVVLTNCPTPAPTWIAYDTKTGKPVSYAATKVPPPYLSTVTLIFYKGHWGVQKTSVDSRQTCTA